MRPEGDDPQTYEIIGAAMTVHRELGPGYLEAVYAEALSIELATRGIPHAREVEMPIFYKGDRLRTFYRADLLCYGAIIVELKAQSSTGRPEVLQVVNYLKASGYELGLLLNFGADSLQRKRVIFKAGWGKADQFSETSEKSEEMFDA